VAESNPVVSLELNWSLQKFNLALYTSVHYKTGNCKVLGSITSLFLGNQSTMEKI